MIFYFISALLISSAIYKLGAYATIITMISAGTKVTMVLLAVVVFALLYRKFRGMQYKSRPLHLPNS